MASVWNYDFMADNLPGKCRMSDIDAILERKGNLLVIEIKAPNAGVPVGQLILLKAMVKAGNTTVYYLWGNTDVPEHYQRLRKDKFSGECMLSEKIPTDATHFAKIIGNWFDWANKHPKD